MEISVLNRLSDGAAGSEKDTAIDEMEKEIQKAVKNVSASSKAAGAKKVVKAKSGGAKRKRKGGEEDEDDDDESGCEH